MPSQLWKRIILALDSPSIVSNIKTALNLRYRPGWVKIGPIALMSSGNRLIDICKDEGFRIFLDLKLHDIPNTMGTVLELASTWAIDWVTIHTLNGIEALKAMVEKGQKLTPPIQCIGVTVLTSHKNIPWHTSRSVHDEVLKLAQWAHESGCAGVVCSPQELPVLRSTFPEDFVLVTPGIRLPGHGTQDQKRVATPWDAFLKGAHAIVMGRSLRHATPEELDKLDEHLSRIETRILTDRS